MGIDIIDLLKQSKWIGCQDDNNVNNSPVVDDTDWEEVIENLEMLRDNHHKKSFAYHTLQKAIDFINKSHTKN